MFKIKNLTNLIDCINELYDYLKSKNFSFDKEGLPIFKKEFFLIEEPELIIPYNCRKSKIVKNKKKTVLCFYCPDKYIYPRISKLIKDMEEYKKFLGVVSPDLTVTKNMDLEWQKLIMLLNQLVMAVFCVNGIKVVFNTRIGSKESIHMLSNVPKNVMCASGFLGCKISYNELDYSYIDKILYLIPSTILIYGKKDACVNEKLLKLGLKFRYYVDFHTLCKKGDKNGR